MPKAYSLSAKSYRVLKKSSSGGIFYLLSKYFIKNLDGIVYGATIEGSDVYHKRVDTLEQIRELQKSKYVKSDLKNVFQECKSDLKNGKYVLFVGLPCQVYSLCNFLELDKISQDRLFCIDLICHGAPSKKTFKEYLDKKFPNETIKKVDFRYKNPFWEGYSILIRTNKRKYVSYKFNDEYLVSFLKSYNLDSACYSCKFKSDNRKSAITIGDFWNVKTLYPKYYNNRGTSLIIVHNETKFNEVFKYLSSTAEIHEVNFEKAIEFNPSYFNTSKKPEGNIKIELKDRKKNFIARIKTLLRTIFKRM